jgi:hypothetical protein
MVQCDPAPISTIGISLHSWCWCPASTQYTCVCEAFVIMRTRPILLAMRYELNTIQDAQRCQMRPKVMLCARYLRGSASDLHPVEHLMGENSMVTLVLVHFQNVKQHTGTLIHISFSGAPYTFKCYWSVPGVVASVHNFQEVTYLELSTLRQYLTL